MEENDIGKLKNKVELKIEQKIHDLEAVKKDLESDLLQSFGQEQEKNQKLLEATNDLLFQLKQAQQNISSLKQP